jgi:hypothetical protein
MPNNNPSKFRFVPKVIVIFQFVGAVVPRDTKPFRNNKGDRIDRIGKPAD